MNKYDPGRGATRDHRPSELLLHEMNISMSEQKMSTTYTEKQIMW